MPQCKATTKSGTQCKLPAGDSDYCHLHDPERRRLQEQQTRARQESNEQRRQRLTQPRFSEREGHKAVPAMMEREGMTGELRNSLWNQLMHQGALSIRSSRWGRGERTRFAAIWIDVLKLPAHRIPRVDTAAMEALFGKYAALEWYEVYDLLEYVLNYGEDPHLVESVNEILERELSAYRFVGGVITDVTSEEEIAMLEEALEDGEFAGVTAHLRRALELLSDRQSPDYRNSIKESISAVESLVQSITGNLKATLGQALNVIEHHNSGITIPTSLKKAYSALYGYTSNEDGIRHAMLEEPSLTASDAKYFLMVCTAFVNYLKAKLPA